MDRKTAGEKTSGLKTPGVRTPGVGSPRSRTPVRKTGGERKPGALSPAVRTPAVASQDATGRNEELNVYELFNRLHGLTLRETSFLPKIAIIGDKSSGKTSVFEALTGLSLPAEKRPLTNFAIHAKFKRTSGEKTGVKAYIRPGPSDSQYEVAVQHLEKFEVLHEGSFAGEDLFRIMHEAANHMYISIVDSDGSDDEDSVDHERQLSDNVLVIEIFGPDVHNLSVIDFPGFLHNSVLHNVQEINAVGNLVMDYIKEPHSVILSVIDATNQIGNQEALELARTFDPEGRRTVGVLTKCDLVQRGDEKRILKICRNKEHHLEQGWFAVKNRSLQDRRDGHGLEQRSMSENTFFMRDPWNNINHSRAGIVSLKEFLGDKVNDMLQENINILVGRISTMNEFNSQANSSRFDSIDSGQVLDEKEGSFEQLHPLSEVPEVVVTSPGDEKADPNLDLELGAVERRPTMLINACLVGLTVALVLTLVGLGCHELAQEIATDGDWFRLFLLVTAPLQIFVSLFFCQSLLNTIIQLIGPVGQMNKNSKYYSAVAVKRLDVRNGPLPHVTVQCPVYKEGLEAVIMPTVESLEAAIRNYESHGGTANIFMNDDGMQLLSPEEAKERRAYYIEHDIGWVARPKHNPNGEGIQRHIRRGKFKKASNMNFAFGISLKVEAKLLEVDRSGVWTQDEEEEAYQKCLTAVLEDEEDRAWAEGDIRIGDYILIVDSDTRIPEECMIDAVSELEEAPQVAILQFSSGVMNVTTSYFETGITFFTNLIYTAIRYAVANGDVSPFVGHNAFLRWSALQEVSFHEDDTGHDEWLQPGEKDPNSVTPYEKFWSESHVSEDFDISLRLQTMGYHIRLGAYCGGDFKEGVSLTVYDELARWEKYAYGCNELLFHPVKYWWKRRGPFTPLFKRFIFSNIPLGSKITILSYIGTYYAIGYAWLGTLLNYFLMGWANGHLDHYYMNSWRVWVALIVVFSGAGNLALAVVRYRGEGLNLLQQLWICFRWVPLLFVFLGGISMHVCQAILSHMFSIDMSWGATAKEVSDTSFFIEMPMIARRFKFVFIFCLAMTALMVCGAIAFPYLWRIDTLIAIFPLACVVFSHFFLPVLLNPALMKFTY